MRLTRASNLTVFIGGAERLVVDAAVGLQKLGHTVEIYTSHHDPAHRLALTRRETVSCVLESTLVESGLTYSIRDACRTPNSPSVSA